MPADDRQLQAIAFLAAACRPHGARHWDVHGIYENVAKVRDRSLGSITIAAIQAAEDRNALTPGVIPKPGPHWRAPEAAPITTADKVAPADHCAGCGKTKDECETRLAAQRGLDPDDPRYDDHAYVPVGAARGHKRGPEVASIVAAVKDELQQLATASAAEKTTTVTPGAGRARIEQASTDHEETTDA